MIMNIGSMSLITPVGVRALIAAGSVEDASIQAISTEGLAVVIKTKKETFVPSVPIMVETGCFA